MGGLGTLPAVSRGRGRVDGNYAPVTVKECVSPGTLRVAENVLLDTVAGGHTAFRRSVDTPRPMLQFVLALVTVRAAWSVPLSDDCGRPDAPSPPAVDDDYVPPLPPAAPPRPKRRPTASPRRDWKRPTLWQLPSFGV